MNLTRYIFKRMSDPDEKSIPLPLLAPLCLVGQ